MSLSDVRDAIVSTLGTAGLGDHVEPHPGRLSLDDLRRLVVRGRSTIRVGCLGVPRIEGGPQGPELDVSWAAFVLAMDGGGISRDAAAMTIAAAVARAAVGQEWGRSDLDQPRDIRADNLFSGQVDARAVALWAVSWRQKWTPTLSSDATLDDLLSVVATWDLLPDTAGEPAPIDTIELEGGS